jgi:hypothetical protein
VRIQRTSDIHSDTGSGYIVNAGFLFHEKEPADYRCAAKSEAGLHRFRKFVIGVFTQAAFSAERPGSAAALLERGSRGGRDVGCSLFLGAFMSNNVEVFFDRRWRKTLFAGDGELAG